MWIRDSASYDGTGRRRYRSYTMNTLDAILTPGTLQNQLVTVAVAFAARRYRRRLMVLSMAYTILVHEKSDE